MIILELVHTHDSRAASLDGQTHPFLPPVAGAPPAEHAMYNCNYVVCLTLRRAASERGSGRATCKAGSAVEIREMPFEADEAARLLARLFGLEQEQCSQWQ